ncbi:MAG TPA: TetR family transcriptional regulator [Pseudonocardiaceae bacterium]|jgi:AcrR family transcriptional regulator
MKEGRRLTRAETKARTRVLLLEAAAHSFARKGFAGASVDDIAASAGFSSGALYSNFAGKEELFVELLASRNSVRLAEAIAVVVDRNRTTRQVRSAISEFLAEIADEDKELAALQAEFWLYAIRRPEFREHLATQFRANRDALAEGLADRGEPAGLPLSDLATVVLALFQGLVQLRRTDPALVSAALYADAAHWLFAGAHAAFDKQN